MQQKIVVARNGRHMHTRSASRVLMSGTFTQKGLSGALIQKKNKGRQEHLHKRSNKGIDAKGATGDSHKRGIATRGDRSKTNTRGASGTLTKRCQEAVEKSCYIDGYMNT